MPARDPTLDLFAPAVSAAVEPCVVQPAPPVPAAARAQRRARELWLALSLPLLPLEALKESAAASTAGKPQGPIVIVDPDDDARTVIACNAAAGHAGIVPGLGLNAAFALTHDLDVRPRNSAREQSLLESLAAGAVAFTPRVSLLDDALLLEVRGSLQLFGGVEALAARLQRSLEGLGITALLALAPTPLAALWLARAQGGATELPVVREYTSLPARLAKLPLTSVRWPERVCQDLQKIGIATVGECLRLPRDGFARRFGPQLLEDLDRALGRLPDLRRIHVPLERYVEHLEFEHEVEDVSRLVGTLEPLLLRMGMFLRKRQCCLRGFNLQLHHRDRSATRVIIRLVTPAADAAHLIELLSERLERIELPAPVQRVRLRSDILQPIDAAVFAAAGSMTVEFEAAERALGPGRPGADRELAQLRVSRLVERLRARLGTDAVHGVRVVPEHRPESASRATEPVVPERRARRNRRKSSDRQPQPVPGVYTPRPLWLLSEPQRLLVEHERPCYEGRLEIEAGPERIESGWWDGKDVTRDYYVARAVDGQRLWIYRERRADRHWFLHGMFA